ncbi:MAG: hypothetical protein GY895_03560, partial [Phycisphaera sp.]|nr:hypothetical protein [Phycisphaera sp.]
MIPTIRPSHLLAAGTLAIATSMAAPASADITKAYVVTYPVNAADFNGSGVTVIVQDLYLASDDAADVVLNIYNMNIAVSGMANYFQSNTGTGWRPTNLGGIFDTPALRLADSFATIGGFEQDTLRPEQAPGAGSGTGIDPNFGGNGASMPGTNAGWYNGSPPSLNGQVGAVPDAQGGLGGLGVLVGRFAYDGDFDLTDSILAVTWNQGLGTPGSQAVFTIENLTVDCNENGVPDYEEIDCNDNNIPDDCEITDGSVPDCNANGIPDGCEITDGSSLDCDLNGIPDACDIASGSTSDYNQNGIPDSCEALSVPGDFESIADAVANAPEGSVVMVDAGTYDQTVIMDRAIAVVAAEGPSTTRIDGAKSLGPMVVADNAPQGAVLVGFTIRAGDPSADHPMGGGVVGIDSNLTIADCVIVGNTGMHGGGLRFEGGAPTIVGCEIRTNLSYEAGGGLRLEGSDATVENCLFERNVVLNDSFGWAIAASDGFPGFADLEVALHGGQPVVLENLAAFPDSTATAERLSIHDNNGRGLVFRGDDPQSVTLVDSRICGNAGVPIDGAYTDLGGNILFTDRCPDLVVPDDAGTIQLAIDTATDGDRIAVRPGTYDEGGLSLAGRDLELVG